MAKKRILIVDDDTKYAELLKARLEQTGDYEVKTESHSSQALSGAREFAPDLMLVDVVMPELDGGQLVERLKADERLKQIPVVFLTSTVTEKEVTQEGGLIGGHAFMAKPVSIPVLVAYLRKRLDS